jgi:hypothetical protein
VKASPGGSFLIDKAASGLGTTSIMLEQLRFSVLSLWLALTIVQRASALQPGSNERLGHIAGFRTLDPSGIAISQSQRHRDGSLLLKSTQQQQKFDHLATLDHRRTQSQLPEVGVALSPFQVMLVYNNSDAMTNNDEMTVLDTTQNYLSSILSENDPAAFSRLLLYQFVRDYPESQHYAKIAFSGTVYYFATDPGEKKIQTDMLFGLVGQNILKFVQALQAAGMKDVVNATLMSIAGNELGILDGEITEIETNEDSGGGGGANDTSTDTVADRSMSDHTRIITVLLSLSIPAAVMFLACCVYASRSLREINWTKGANPDSPVWHTLEHNRMAKLPSKEFQDAHQHSHRMSKFSAKEFEEAKIEEYEC